MIVREKLLEGSHVCFDAVVFDLDGVLTDTAKVHATAWKSLFDDYLLMRATGRQEDFYPFDLESDYRCYVDGKPRYDGVRSFLRSRGIALPDGDPTSSSEEETVCGLGNRKNRIFHSILARDGVEVFESSVHLIRKLRAMEIRCGVASSSQNCQQILRRAGIEELFDARVDGTISVELNLKGKPNPDIFLKCVELLDASVSRSVLVEDAISGVQAGRNGGFGLVIGVDRAGFGAALKENGADVVVLDLAEVSPGDIDSWCRSKQSASEGVFRFERPRERAAERISRKTHGEDSRPLVGQCPQIVGRTN